MMRIRVALEAWVALGASALLFLLGAADVLPWPGMATRSLAVILVLVAVTRIGGDSGLKLQRRLRYAVAGVSLTAGTWFVVGAQLADNGPYVTLGLCHLLAAWLSAAPEPDRAERGRGLLILSATMATVSLLALGTLAVPLRGTTALPLVLAGVTVVGAMQIAQGRLLGLILAALAGVVTLLLSGFVIADVASAGGAAEAQARSAPLLAATAILGSLPPIGALVGRAVLAWRDRRRPANAAAPQRTPHSP